MPTTTGLEIGDLVTLNPDHYEYEFCRRVLNERHPDVKIFRIINIEMGRYIRTTPSELGLSDQNRWMKVSTKKRKRVLQNSWKLKGCKQMPHFEVGERVRYIDDYNNADVFAWFQDNRAIDARTLEFTVIGVDTYLRTTPENYGFNYWARFEIIPEDGKKKRHQKKPSRFKQFLNTHKL